MAGKVVLTGYKKLDRKLMSLGKEGLKIVRKVLRAEQKKIATQVKSALPVGETRQSKKKVKVKSGKRSRVRISTNTVAFDADPKDFYSPKVEFGTKNQPAQGNWRKFWDKNKATAKKNLISNIWSGIHRHAKGK